MFAAFAWGGGPSLLSSLALHFPVQWNSPQLDRPLRLGKSADEVAVELVVPLLLEFTVPVVLALPGEVAVAEMLVELELSPGAETGGGVRLAAPAA